MAKLPVEAVSRRAVVLAVRLFAVLLTRGTAEMQLKQDGWWGVCASSCVRESGTCTPYKLSLQAVAIPQDDLLSDEQKTACVKSLHAVPAGSAMQPCRMGMHDRS